MASPLSPAYRGGRQFLDAAATCIEGSEVGLGTPAILALRTSLGGGLGSQTPVLLQGGATPLLLEAESPSLTLEHTANSSRMPSLRHLPRYVIVEMGKSLQFGCRVAACVG